MMMMRKTTELPNDNGTRGLRDNLQVGGDEVGYIADDTEEWQKQSLHTRQKFDRLSR